MLYFGSKSLKIGEIQEYQIISVVKEKSLDNSKSNQKSNGVLLTEENQESIKSSILDNSKSGN